MNEPSYLLGIAYALLTQCRAHLIKMEDLDGIALIEDDYQSLHRSISDLFYKRPMEIKDEKQGR